MSAHLIYNTPDCLIVGGGLIGMMTARELAQAGMRVAVLERGETGREASWAGGGILSPLYPWRYPEPVTDLAIWGQARYEALTGALREESGVDPEWTRSGLLMLDCDDTAAARAWADEYGYDMALVEAEALSGIEPRLAPQTRPGLWMPAVAQVRNPRLVRALRGSLDALGVSVLTGTEVTGLSQSGDRITGVQTTAGELQAGKVVIASGAWSADLLNGTGLALPVVPVRGQMLLFRAPVEMVRRIVLSRDRYVIPRRDGHVLLGSTLERTGFDKSTTEAARQELQEEALRLIPALADCPIERHWAGLRPGSPEGIPYIGPHPRLRGLYLNTGHFRNGVVLGAASARLAADWILERPLSLEAAAYLPQLAE